MPENNNAAFRAWRVLSDAAGQSQTAKTHEAWAAVFGIRSDNALEEIHEVGRMLHLLRAEIELAATQMSGTSFSGDLYEDAFNKARRAISAGALGTNWQSGRTYLTSETLSKLKWCSEVLPDEERVIPEAALGELSEQLEKLRQTVETGDLPDEVKAFVLRLIRIIEWAVCDYPISGSDAFKQAVVAVAVEFADNHQLVEAHADAAELRSWSQIWNKVIDLAKLAGAARILVETGGFVAGLLGAG